MVHVQHTPAHSRTNGNLLRGLIAVAALLGLMAQSIVAQTRPDSFADLAADLSPAVVNITTSTVISQASAPGLDLPEGSPLEDLFRNLPQFQDRPENGPQRRGSALGSGFVISEDGYIVTNNHVIESADEIMIEFFDGAGELPATLIGTDPRTDIALLKVEPDRPLPFVAFGDRDASRVGDWVIAIGNPLGQGFSVSAGIVSARGRALSGAYDDFIQTDAAINRGNSGGPLFNMDGEVIGVNTAILSPNGGSIGIGFSMSSNVVKNVVQQLRDFGETRRGWLGVSIQDITPDVAEALGLDDAEGALVTEVPDGPASAAGIKSGDVILSFDGKDIKDTRELVRMVGEAEVGKTVRVVVFREGGTETVGVELGRRENAEVAFNDSGSTDPVAPLEQELHGMTVSALTPALRGQFNLSDEATGVLVIDVDTASEAFEKGLRSGDIIAEIGQKPILTPAELETSFLEAKEAGRKSVLLLVKRGDAPRFVALSPEE